MSSARSPIDELPLLIADLFEAAGAVRRHGDTIASLAGQTQARWQVLSVLSQGDWTVPRAARRLGVSRQAVQRTVDLLRAAGLVEIEHNPDHRRSPLVRLTDAGHQALAAITAEGRRWNALVASRIDARDLATTRSVLRALIDTT
jgi:DNA-binding MarR family transcriptional regulator